MEKPPLLLMDVDGVLFPVTQKPSSDFRRRRLEEGSAEVWFSWRVAGRLAMLDAHFEVVWCTAWGADANRLVGRAHGIGARSVIDFPPAPSIAPGQTWKLAGVAAFVAERPLAWIDDELGEDAHRWALSRRAPTLLVPTDPGEGLNDEHVRRLVEFARPLR